MIILTSTLSRLSSLGSAEDTSAKPPTFTKGANSADIHATLVGIII